VRGLVLLSFMIYRCSVTDIYYQSHTLAGSRRRLTAPLPSLLRRPSRRQAIQGRHFRLVQFVYYTLGQLQVLFARFHPRFGPRSGDTTDFRGNRLDSSELSDTPARTQYLVTTTQTHHPYKLPVISKVWVLFRTMSIPESTFKEQQEPKNMAFLTTHYLESSEKHEKVEQKGSPGKTGGGNLLYLLLVTASSLMSPELQTIKLHKVSNVETSALSRSALSRRAPDRLTSLLPPDNFGAVIPSSVYRSSFPLPENFSFLGSLKLKTILTLVPKPFPDAYVEFMESNGIRQIVIPIAANKDVVCIEDTTMIQALGVVLDRSHYPLLIHCNKGKHRTGCTVACLRKIQGEGNRSALHEYHTYAGSKARSLDETFIRSFDERSLLWLARENGLLYPDEPTIDSPSLVPGMLARPRG
jgi:tyrosine-protein phosphatase SIW14